MGADDIEAETRLRIRPLDDTLLESSPEEEAFFKFETGIQDTEELRKHIIEVQADAYKVSRHVRRSDEIHRGLGQRVTLYFVFSGLPVSLHSGVRVRKT